jgi:hypothetical protein
MLRMVNLRPDGALTGKANDCRLARLGIGKWKAGTSEVVAPVCVG